MTAVTNSTPIFVYTGVVLLSKCLRRFVVAKKKKKPADSTATGDSNEVKDNRFTVKNSKQTAFNFGSGTINQKIEKPKKPINVRPYDENELSFLGIGERLMRRLYGTYDHDLKRWTLYAIIGSILSGAPLGVPFVPGTPVPIGSPSYIPLFYTGMVGIILTILLGWGPIEMARRTECPKCHYKFSLFDVKKTMTNREHLSEAEEVRNFKVKRRCENCRYEDVVDRVQHIYHEPPNNNGDNE